jgi:hypothetical protein
MDLNKKLIDQLSDLSRNIKSLTSEVKENRNIISPENAGSNKENSKDNKNIESPDEQNKNFLKSLENIFKKGIGEITKSSSIIKDIGKEKIKETKNNEPPISSVPLKAIDKIIGNLPKFYKGGVMNKNGLAIVGEKGPEIVKLEKGAEVIPNEKSSSVMKTADQSVLEKKGPTPDQVEKYKNELEKDNFYKSNPDRLEEDLSTWKKSNKRKSQAEINSLIEKEGYKNESVTKETPTNLSETIKPVKGNVEEDKTIAKERSTENKASVKKEEPKKLEDVTNPKSKESEKTPESEMKDKAKTFLKEKGVFEKGKDILLSQGKNILENKISLKDALKEKGTSSLMDNKNQLVSKGIGSATSLLSNKNLREKGIDKIKSLSEKNQKSTISTESSELKKPKPEIKKEEPKESEEPKKEKKEIVQKETPKKEEEFTKKENTKSSSISLNKSSEKAEKGISPSDLDDIKSLLGKIASLLEGPLSIETNESPFRPDSRRF